MVSPSLPPLDESRVRPKYSTLLPSPMPAHLPASASLLKADGEPGASSRVGRQTAEILVGPSPSVSSSLYALSSLNAPKPPSLRHTETTGVLSRAGGRAAAETGPRISLSEGFTTSSLPPNPLSSPATYQARQTLPTVPQEANIPQWRSFSHQSIFPSNSVITSLISTPLSLRSNSISINVANSLSPSPDSLATFHHTPQEKSTPNSNTKPGNSSRSPKNIDSGDHPSLPFSASKAPNPTPYAKHLRLTPSSHRPHCLARDRLRIWTLVSPQNTLDANSTPTNLSQSDLT